MASRGPKPLSEKACTTCGIVKPRSSFYVRSKNGQVLPKCKECYRIAYKRERETNPEKIREYKRRARTKHAAAIAEYQKKYHATNRKAIYKQISERCVRDVAFRLARSIRRDIPTRLRKSLATKSDGTFRLVGCSIGELMKHIESQWQPGMSWDNWGRGDGMWHIDHKKPVATFDLAQPSQQRECFHYTNLQPLWQADNLRKGCKYSEGMCGV